MDLLQAIYQRRSVRDFTERAVSRPIISKLLEAAVQAPSAVNSQPWAFTVIEDRQLLARYSSRAKSMMLESGDPHFVNAEFREMLSDPDFIIFYNAPLLIVIWARPIGPHPDWDCCFAAQNLLLAAEAQGLATCPIGFAWSVLEKPDVKRELNVPAEYRPVFPVIVGYPRFTAHTVPRKPPEVLCWRESPA